jgi:hypothetical protein
MKHEIFFMKHEILFKPVRETLAVSRISSSRVHNEFKLSVLERL